MAAPPDDDDSRDLVDGDGDDQVSRLETVDAFADPLAAVSASALPHSAAGADPLVGRGLGRFIITARLGKGGMGVVYRARDPELRRDVAIKVLPTEASRDPERRARFLREARAAAGLTHASIAAIYDVGFDEREQLAFIAMELVDGEELRLRLNAAGLPLAEVERIALQVARGLARAHSAAVVHRDLKPENIMITPEGDAKILDFGLAKTLDTAQRDGHSTVDGLIMGTPGYMAPEQVRGERVDARADVFAFGVILHELLAGHLPFAGATPMALALAVTIDTPLPLARPDAPGLVALATRCMEKDPARRPADGRALVEMLVALLGSGIEGSPARMGPSSTKTPVRRLLPSGRRGRVVASLGVGAVLMVAVVAVALRVAHVGPFATPEARLRALLEDPEVPIACLPFTASGDIGARELGLVAGASACEVLENWLWSAERVRPPAALLHLPKSGDASSDVFFSDEGRAALAAATVDAPIVVNGAIRVDRAGTHITWRVSVRGGGVVEATSTEVNFLLAANAIARRVMEQVGLPARALPDDDRRIYGVATGRDMNELNVLASRPVKDQATCASLATLAPRLTALFHAEACGHPERTTEGLPAWPPGALDLAGATDIERAWVQVRVVAQPTPEQARAWAATLHAGRGTASSILAGELAGVEGMALVKAGDIDGARAAYDVAIESWPNNAEAWFGRLGLEQDTRSLARSMSVWFPTNSTTWAYRADEDGDGSDAIAMHELKYYLDDRVADSVLNLAEKLFAARAVGRLQALASFHRDRARPGDTRTAAFLLALSEAADGRIQAAFDRLRTLTLAAERVDWSTVFAVTHAVGNERLLGQTGLADALLERFVLSEAVPVDPAMDAELFGPLLGAASPAVGARAVTALRARLENGKLQSGARTHVTLEGYARFFAGDAKGAAALWRRIADVYGTQITARAFEAAGEHELAERRHRMYVDHSPKVATYGHAMLAKKLAARGAIAEARALAELFIARYTRTDAPIPLVDDMKAILRDHPGPTP